MESVDMHKILHPLVDAWESEVVEFKEASKDYKTPEIYRYCSALSNEANLRGVKSACLVFGVRNKDKQIVGTDFRLQHDQLHNLKQQVKQSTLVQSASERFMKFAKKESASFCLNQFCLRIPHS